MMKYLIAGLGNIGSEYAKTRHNIGFRIVQAFADSKQTSFQLDRHAYVAEVKEKNKNLILIQPTTYMNLSGKAIQYWMNAEHIPVENILVIVDDIDLPFGSLKLLGKGGGGSHNGMNHIIEILGHQNFARLRFGIDKNYSKGYQIDYVLGEFSAIEQQELPQRIDKAVEVIKSFVLQGIQRTMNQVNAEKYIFQN